MSTQYFVSRQRVSYMRSLALAAIAAIAAGWSGIAWGANWAWSTSPGTTWNANNWTSGQTPGAATGKPAANDVLYFGTSSQTTLNNDYTAATQFNGINFNNSAASFTLSGNSLTLGGNITVGTGITTETISFDMVSTSVRTITVNSGTLTLGGIISGTAGGITKAGTGSLILAGNDTFTGATTINAGTLQISGSAGKSTSAQTVNIGGTLSVDNTAGAGGILVNRLSSKNLTLAGGTFNYISGTGASTDNTGTLAINSGGSTINLTANASGATTVTATSMTHATGGTLFLAGANLGAAAGANNANLILSADTTQVGGTGTAGSTTIAINPYVLGRDTALSGNNQYGFMTDKINGAIQANGLRQLLLATEYATVITDASTVLDNVSLTSAATGLNSATTKINALRLDAGGSVAGSGTLTINSGGIISLDAANTIAVSTLAFGTQEAIIQNVAALGISSSITGSGGLTKSGAGTLTLSSANTYSGATYVNAGTLNLANQNAVSNSTVTMQGGALGFDSSVSGNAFTFGGLAATSSGTGYDTGLTNSLGNAIVLTVGNNNASGSYAGVLSGAGSLYKTGTGALTLSGVNTFSGDVNISAGTLIADNRYGASAGAGGLGGSSVARNINIAAGAALQAGGSANNANDSLGSRGNYTSLLIFNVNGGTLSIGPNGSSTQWQTSLTTLNLNGGSVTNPTSSATSYLTLNGTVTVGGVAASIMSAAAGFYALNNATANHITTFNVSNVVAGTDLTISAPVRDATLSGTTFTAANLIKTGAGTMLLSATNTYTGTTIISNGTLLVNGSLSNGAVTVVSGGTLGGTGTIAGAVTVNAGGTNLLGATGATLTLASATAPAYGAYSKLKIDASASTLDKISVAATTGNSVTNVDLVIDTTGLSGDVSSTTIYSAGGAIAGPFHSTYIVGNTAYLATLDYSTSGQIKLGLTGTSALATKLVITSSAVSAVAGVSSSAITVQRQDAGSSAVTSDADLVINLSSTSGTGSFRDAGDAGTITTVTIPYGSSTASFLYRDTLAGAPTITTASGSLESGSQQETVTPGAASRLVVTGSGSQTAGASQNLTITAKDSYGNTDTSYTGSKSLTFTGANSSVNPVTAPTVKDNGGTAVAFGTATVITFNNGVATVSGGNNGVMSLYKAESATISVTDQSISSSGGDRLSVTVSASSASTITTTSGNSQSGGLNRTLTNPFVVTVADAYGNPVSGATVDFAVASAPGGATGQSLSSPQNPASASSGLASNTLTLGSVSGPYTVTATVALNGSNVTFTAQAGGVVKAATGAELTTGANWTGGFEPGSGDVAQWISTSLGGSLTLGSSRSWAGIAMTDATVAPTISAGNTLTLGTSGIDLSASLKDMTLASGITLGASQTWSVNASRTLTVSGNVDGTGKSLIKTGSGTLTLGGANTFDGGLAIQAGTVKLNTVANSAGAGPVTIGSAGNSSTLNLNGASRTILSLATAGTAANQIITSTAAGGILNFTGATNSTFGGVISGAANTAVTVNNGSAKLTLSGQNTYSGATTLTAGELDATTYASALGAGVLTLNGTATLRLANDTGLNFGRNTTVSANMTIQSDTLTAVAGVTHTLGTLSIAANQLNITHGETVSGGSPAITFGVTTLTAGPAVFDVASGVTLTLGAVGGGAYALTKQNDGTLTLSGVNTYTGDTTVSGGTLTISGSGQLNNGAYAGAITNSGILNYASSTNQTLSGTISQTGALTLTGSGTLTLSGGNTYTGATSVNSGTLLVSSPGSLASGSAVTVASGATLGGNGTIHGPVSVSSGGSLTPGGVGTIGLLSLGTNLTVGTSILAIDVTSPGVAGTDYDQISVAGTNIVNGPAIIQLNPTTGTIPAGDYTLMTYAARSGNSQYVFPNGTTNLVIGASTLTLTNGPTSLILGVSGDAAYVNLKWKGTTAIWDIGTTSNWLNNGTSSTYSNGNSVTFDDTATGYTVSGTNLQPASVLFNNSVSNYTVSATTNTIAGATAVTKMGSGTVTLSGTNTFSGGLNIKAGMVSLGYATSAGSGTITLGDTTGNNSATLNISAAVSPAIANPIVLEDNINQPTLTISSSVNNTRTFSGGVTGAGNLTLSSSGSANLKFTTSSLSHVGHITGMGNGTGVDPLTISCNINNTGSITNAATGSGNMSISGNIGPNVTAVVQNSATSPMILSGGNTYNGSTTINAGTLFVNGTNTVASGAGTYTVSSGGTLGGSGRIDLSAVNGTVTVNVGGKLSPGSLAGVAGTNTLALGSGSLDLSAAASTAGTLVFDLAATNASDRINLASGTLNIGSGLLNLASFQFGGILNPGQTTYTLITSANLVGTLASSGLTGSVGGATNSSLAISGNNLVLTLAGFMVQPVTWKGNVSGVWGGDMPNWVVTGSSTPAYYVDTAAVTFNDTAASNFTVSSVFPVTPASITVSNNVNAYALSTVIAGSGSLTKAGTSTLALSAANTFTGDVNINAGTLKADGPSENVNSPTASALGDLTVARNININSNATLWVQSSGTANDILGSIASQVVPTINVNGGTLKVGNNNVNFTETFNTINLNGGTMTLSAPTGTGWAELNGTVTVGGFAVSTMSGVGNNTYALANTTSRTTTFNVSNVVAGTDLVVSAPFVNGTASATPSHLVKTGPGTMLLSATNTYTGATTISNGTLLVNGTVSNGAVTVVSGATLGGSGTIYGAVTNRAGSFLAPGDAADTIGKLNLASTLTLSGGYLALDLRSAGAPGIDYDQIVVAGALTMSGANVLQLNAPSGSIAEGTYTLMTFATSTASSFTFPNGTTGMAFGDKILKLNNGTTSLTMTSQFPAGSVFKIR